MYREDLLSRSYRVFLMDELEQYEETISYLSDQIGKVRNSATLNNRGLAYSEIGRFDEALEDFENAIEVDANNPIPHINKADLFKRAGRLGEAIDSCSSAIAVGKDVTFLRFRAYLMIDEGRLEEALSDLDQAVIMEPSHRYTVEKRDEIRHRLSSTPPPQTPS